MSKARLVIAAVVLQGRTQAEAARCYGVSKGWVSKLVARDLAEGEAAFEPRSTPAPLIPTRDRAGGGRPGPTAAQGTVRAGLDAGPPTIGWHLAHHRQLHLAPSTIARHLTTAGLVTPQPHK